MSFSFNFLLNPPASSCMATISLLSSTFSQLSLPILTSSSVMRASSLSFSSSFSSIVWVRCLIYACSLSSLLQGNFCIRLVITYSGAFDLLCCCRCHVFVVPNLLVFVAYFFLGFLQTLLKWLEFRLMLTLQVFSVLCSLIFIFIFLQKLWDFNVGHKLIKSILVITGELVVRLTLEAIPF